MSADRSTSIMIRERGRSYDALAESYNDNTVVYLVKTVAIGTYPTAAKAYYGYEIQRISGNESEGAVPTLTSAGYPRGVMLNLGNSIPPAGTAVLMSLDRSGKFIFQY